MKKPIKAIMSSLAALAIVGCGTTTASEQPATTAPETSASAATITVVDDQKRSVELQLPVERAVVLNSYANEFVNAIGAGDAVVGTDRASQRRLGYLNFSDAEIVAESIGEINYEAVVALDPDVVIIPRNGAWEDAAKQLESFDIPVVVATAWDYAVFHDTVDLLGQVFQKEDGAKALSAFYDEIFTLVKDRVAGTQAVRTYWETGEPFLTVLPGSGFHAIIEAANGDNVFTDFSVGASNDGEATVDPVDVVERDPEVIIYEFEPSATPTGQANFDEISAEIAGREGFSQITAVKDDRVYIANGWTTSGLAKAIGALYLGKWLHPDKFTDVEPVTYLEKWVTEFQHTDFAGEEAYIQKAKR
ncbi:MAG: ABC transporter substrate-binding protein [Propionibacteriaceae bacterium]|nr:ABC transporter substrate-binding protein [Propionibacteriaceae bacterium]